MDENDKKTLWITVGNEARRVCASCDEPTARFKDLVSEYFETGFARCPNCGTFEDLWKTTQLLARQDVERVLGLSILGANTSVFLIALEAGETKEIDFVEHKVPESAVILSVSYMLEGDHNCLPIQIHGKMVGNKLFDVRNQLFDTKKIEVYGMPLNEDSGSAIFICLVTWVHEEDDSEAWTLMAEAFEAAAQQRYSRVLAPAHAAVEVTLTRLIRRTLLRTSSEDSVNQFIVNDLTASSAQNVMLPLLCAQVGVKPLSEEIRGKLNRLRRLRNAVIHEGLIDEDVDKAEVGELLCAAAFAFEFVRYLKFKVRENQNSIQML